MHTLLDLRGNIPAFIHITDGKTHEVNVLDTLSFEAGAFYVMDRGYLDYKSLFTLHWCAVATYALIAIVKKELQIDASLYTLLQILSVSVFEKKQLQQALQDVIYIPEQRGYANQLNLFNF